jgi:hypothetical protein
VIGGCCDFLDESTQSSQLEGSFGNFRKSVEHVNSNWPDTGMHYRLQEISGGSARLRSAFSAVVMLESADLEGVVMNVESVLWKPADGGLAAAAPRTQ